MSTFLKILTILLILSVFKNEIAFARSIKMKRSPDFWDSIKSIFGATTTPNPCQEYSADGDCLGNIDEATIEYKCVFCKNTSRCKLGCKQDRLGKCRKLITNSVKQKSNKV
ncbi:hypothetical protein ACKWTF_006127 [Chironomus riparius]